MRYWVTCLALLFLFVSLGISQDAKKKEKDPGKESGGGGDTEPTEILGKSFKEWKAEIHHKDPSKRETAVKSIMQFGPNKAYDALPDILAELKKHSAKTPVDLSFRINGTMAVSTIFKYKKEPDPKYAKDAVAIYKTFLKDDQMMMKIRTVQGLPFLGPTCRDALPEVVAMAKNTLTWEARKEAIQVLGLIGFEDKGVPMVPVMGEVLKAVDIDNERSFQVRIAALRSIGNLGRAADPTQKGPIIAKLNTVLDKDDDPHVLITTHVTIMTIEGKVTTKHLAALVRFLKSKDAEVRVDAIQSIGMLGKDAKPALAGLLDCLDDPEPTVAVTAIVTMANIDDSAKPYMEKVKNDKKAPEIVRAAATEAIAYIEMREKLAKEAKDKKDKKDK
jgi:HEAT repeat protein